MILLEDAAVVAGTLGREGRSAESLAIWRLILSVAPKRADAAHALGCAALDNGQIKEALSLLACAQAVEPERPGIGTDAARALNATAQHIKTLYDSGQTEEARTLYAHLLQVDPSGRHLRLLLDSSHPDLPRILMGLDLLELAIAQVPDNGLYPRLVAKLIELALPAALAASSENGSHDLISQLCRVILRHQPDYAFVLHLLGITLRRAGRQEEAVLVFRRALTLDPTLHGVHYNLARTLTQGQSISPAVRNEAIQLLGRSQLLYPTENAISLQLIWNLLAVGRYGEARRHYEDFHQRAPRNLEYFQVQSAVEAQFFNWGKAEAAARAALCLEPAKVEAVEMLGMTLLEQDSLDEAARVLRRGCLFPDAPDAMGLRLTDAYDRLGQPEEALRAAWLTRERRFDHTYQSLWVKDPVGMVLDRIDAEIPLHIDRDGALVYLMHGIGSIGHLVTEIATLVTLYGPRYRRIILLCRHPASVKGVNPEVFRIATQHVTVIPIQDTKVLDLSYAEAGLFERGNTAYLLNSWRHIYRCLFHHTRTGVKRTRHGLLPDQMERGHALQRKLGIPDDARIVVMHLRQAPADAVNRNVSPEKYHATIRHLVREGYFLIRIGDPKMTPLPDLGREVNAQILDAPFSPHYEPLIDPYFIHQSDFMLSSQSGPAEIARIFHKPTITPNVPLVELYTSETVDYFGFRRYIDHSSGRPRRLGFTEIMRLHHDIHYVTRLAVAGIEIEEQSAEEILDVVKEALQPGRLEEGAPMSAPQRAFRDLAEQEYRRRTENPGMRMRYLDWFSYATDYVRAADCSLAAYPELLA